MPSKGFAKNLGQKAQAGLEYLITYGWALIAIATIIGVLIFTAGGGVNTNTCTTFLSLVCKGIVADGDTLVMVLQNATGQKISITPFEDICFDGHCGYGKIEYGGKTYSFDTVKIGTGDQFKIFGAGQVLAGEIRITYKEETTGLEKTVTSTLGTSAPTNTELSNDGIDNDGDGFIDCQQAGYIDCEYVVDATGVSSTTIGTSNVTIGQIIGTSGTPVTDNLWAEDMALAFYANPPVTAGTTAQVTYGMRSPTTIAIKEGWNVAEIDMSSGSEIMLFGALMSDFIITRQAGLGADFVIDNSSKKPKAYFVVNKTP